MAIDFKNLVEKKAPSSRGIDFTKLVAGMQLNEKPTPVSTENKGGFHPIDSFVAGVKSHTSQKQEWNPIKLVLGYGPDIVKSGSEALNNQTDRVGNAFQPAVDAYLNGEDIKTADVISGIGNYVMGIVNTAYAPVGETFKYAEKVPVLGYVADVFNKGVAGLANVGSNTFGSTLNALPVSQETKDKLTPLANEVGSLVGIILGLKGAGKVYGKASESRFVKPRIEALNTKLTEIGNIIKNDPKLSTEVARFVTEHGPVRNVPITSETPNGRQVPATPNQKHAVYAKSQGYEPITPDSQLPSISIGDTAPSKELPTIDYTTGQMSSGTADVGQYQMSLNEAPKVKTSTLLEENRNNPKTDTPTTTEKPKEPTYLSEEYHNMLVEMELSEKGYRYPRGEHDATQSESQWQGVSSTFPDWVPSKLRLTSLFDKFLKDRTGTTEDLNIQYKKGSRLDRLQQAFIENLKFLEEQNRKERETKQLMEEANAEIERQRTKEDAASAEAEYAKMQGGSPVQDSVPTGNQELMQPVASEGKAMTPALTKNAVERLSKDMQQQFATSNVPMYNKASWTGIANKVIAEFNADPAYAMDIAMGRIKLEHDSGMTQTAFWVEAMHRAEQAGDAQMMLDLSRSKVSGFATAAGQEIGYLANLEEGNPVILIKKINDSLKESYKNAKKGDPEKRVINEIDTIEKFIKESTLPKEKWIEVIKGIKDC